MKQAIRTVRVGQAVRLECGCLCLVETAPNTNDLVGVHERRLCRDHGRAGAMFVRLRPGREMVEHYDTLTAALEDPLKDE